MSDQPQQPQQQPLDTVSTAIVERRTLDQGQGQGQPRLSITSTTVQYLLRWSQVSLSSTQRTTATLIDPTGGRRGICTPPVPNGPQHIALLPILEWAQAQSPECNTTTQILTAYQSGALAAVFHLPEGQSDQSTMRRTSLANLPIPVLLLTDQAYSIELAKSVSSANVSLASPADVASSPTRVSLTLNPRAEVGMSTSSTWSIVGITVGVALGAVLLTSLLMHVQLWRMRRARARKAFVRAVHDVEERVLAHHQGGDNDDDEHVADHLLSKAMLDDLPIKPYTPALTRVRPTSKRSSLASSNAHTHRDSRRFSVYSLLSRLDHTPLAAAPEAKAARDRRVQSWLVPHDQEVHLLPLSPRMRTSIVSRTSLDLAHAANADQPTNPKAMVKENLSPNARARSPLATDRVPRDGAPAAAARRARPVSFHPDTRGGDNDAADADADADAFVVPPMSPNMPSPPASPTVGHRPALVPAKPHAHAQSQRGSWASLDANPRAKVAENMGAGRAPRPLSMLNPAAAGAAAGTRRKSSDAASRRQSRPVSVIHTLFPLLPGSPYLHSATDPAGAPAGESAPVGNDSCPICVDALVDGDLVRELPCAHVFHVACVDAWLTEEVGECPLCKFDVRGWWEREMGDDEEDGETESSSEDEQEALEQRKGGWFARTFGGRNKNKADEERGLEPVPKARKQRAVGREEGEQPAAVATGLGITSAAAEEPAPATLEAAAPVEQAPVAPAAAAAAAGEAQAPPADK